MVLFRPTFDAVDHMVMEHNDPCAKWDLPRVTAVFQGVMLNQNESMWLSFQLWKFHLVLIELTKLVPFIKQIADGLKEILVLAQEITRFSQ